MEISQYIGVCLFVTCLSIFYIIGISNKLSKELSIYILFQLVFSIFLIILPISSKN